MWEFLPMRKQEKPRLAGLLPLFLGFHGASLAGKGGLPVAQDGGTWTGAAKGPDGPLRQRLAVGLPRGQRWAAWAAFPAVAQGVQPAGSCQEEEGGRPERCPKQTAGAAAAEAGPGRTAPWAAKTEPEQTSRFLPVKPAQRKLVPAWRTKYSQAPGARRADRWQATAAQRQMGVRFHGEYLPQAIQSDTHIIVRFRGLVNGRFFQF